MVRRCHEQRGSLLVEWLFTLLNRGVARMQLFEKAADYQGSPPDVTAFRLGVG